MWFLSIPIVLGLYYVFLWIWRNPHDPTPANVFEGRVFPNSDDLKWTWGGGVYDFYVYKTSEFEVGLYRGSQGHPTELSVNGLVVYTSTSRKLSKYADKVADNVNNRAIRLKELEVYKALREVPKYEG